MKNYWSCSKFADWLRGSPKPSAATAEQWIDWKSEARKKKFRYWLAEDCLSGVQRFIFWPAHRFADFRRYTNNRWFIKSHAMTSNLARGNWYDFDTRLLHTVFDELINFVEIEQAWMCVAFSMENQKKYKTPWYRAFLRFGLWRCPEAGVAYLNWASELRYDEECTDKNDPSFAQFTPQALAAQETLKLYRWWKEVRPQRPDPMDASGWSDYCDENKIPATRGSRAISILDRCHKMEAEQRDEDTAMLIRLIKIRSHFWT